MITKHIGHHGKNIPYHMNWNFRQKALRSTTSNGVVFNFYLLATPLKDWMQQKGQLHFSTSKDSKLAGITNPYSHAGSILAISFAQVVNDCYEFTIAQEPMTENDAEVKRLRLYTESVLYAARINECFIKQLLFCTDFRDSYYQKAALSALLSRDCTGCRDSKRQPHRLSLLGSLAHRYHLCNEYEQCLSEHMKIVNRRRNIEAGHSAVGDFEPKTVSEVRSQLKLEALKIGEELLHMLTHIADIEQRMLEELQILHTEGKI